MILLPSESTTVLIERLERLVAVLVDRAGGTVEVTLDDLDRAPTVRFVSLHDLTHPNTVRIEVNP